VCTIFGILGLRISEGGEDREFELWYLELPVREIALTVGLRGESWSLISFGDGTSEFRKIGNRDFGSRGEELHDIATPEIMIRRKLKRERGKSSVDYFRHFRVERIGCLTTRFMKSRSLISRTIRGDSSRFVVG
jgi:hypothetical protein